mmetsp:Transcript_3899/g.11972  ORF Transcript_3899/g.11972 Transcript_3899/m.11972 type:complete len:464 (+) Transcript_3899:174-1565(+)
MSSATASGSRRRLPLAVGALLVVVMFALARLLSRGAPGVVDVSIEQPNEGYVVIVDAGSSGCRAHAFRWEKTSEGGVKVDPKHNSMKVRPGLSSFAEEPAKAGESLAELLRFLEEEIPEDRRAATPVFLKATAGLRMLPPAQSEAILASVRTTLAASPFSFDEEHGAKIIAGTDEGGFGWMSVNYLMRSFEDEEYVGVVEMGGASAQVTQIVQAAAGSLRGPASQVPDGYSFTFSLGAKGYELYAKSYLGYGLEAARRAVTFEDGRDPCLPPGFEKTADDPRASVYEGPEREAVVGVGDFEKCRAAIVDRLFSGDAKCEHPSCSHIDAAFQPKTLPDSKLLVFENFYYTAAMLGLALPNNEPQRYRFEAKQLCPMTWDDLLASAFPKDGSDKADLVKLCFSAVYLDVFLERGLGLKPDKKIIIQQEVDGDGIDWSLGAAIHEANRLFAPPAGIPSRRIKSKLP